MYIIVDIGVYKTDVVGFANFKPSSKVFFEQFKTPNKYLSFKKLVTSSIINAKKVSEIATIVVSFPGILGLNGEIIQASNISDYNNKPLRSDLKEEFGAKVLMIHDSAASAIAEISEGINGIENFSKILHVCLGSGIGTALIEVAPIRLKPIPMFRKIVSPLESGGIIMGSEDKRKHEKVNMEGILESYVGGEVLNNRLKKDLAETSDKDNLWNEYTDYLAVGLHNINCILKPELVIIGGKIGSKRAKVLKNTVYKMQKYSDILRNPEIRFTRVKGESKTLGALAMLSLDNVIINPL